MRKYTVTGARSLTSSVQSRLVANRTTFDAVTDCCSSSLPTSMGLMDSSQTSQSKTGLSVDAPEFLPNFKSLQDLDSPTIYQLFIPVAPSLAVTYAGYPVSLRGPTITQFANNLPAFLRELQGSLEFDMCSSSLFKPLTEKLQSSQLLSAKSEKPSPGEG